MVVQAVKTSLDILYSEDDDHESFLMEMDDDFEAGAAAAEVDVEVVEQSGEFRRDRGR